MGLDTCEFDKEQGFSVDVFLSTLHPLMRMLVDKFLEGVTFQVAPSGSVCLRRERITYKKIKRWIVSEERGGRM